MNMTNLLNCVDAFNASTLPALLPPGSVIAPGTASGTTCSHNLPVHRDFCGLTKSSSTPPGYSGTNSFIDRCLSLVDPATPQTPKSTCVGAVIDHHAHAADEDLPVVLAVGINYGQGWQGNNVPLVAATGMRPKLLNAFSFLAAHACPAKAAALNGRFHLVAANVFPWITSLQWSAYGFNSIEEAAFIHCCGHANPEKYISDLIEETSPLTIVFHGANNAVPDFGTNIIRSFLQQGADTEVIFSDNLAPSIQTAITNAIHMGLYQCGRKSLASSDFDE